MGRPLDADTFTGAHPTAREFHDQLLAWGFRQRREDGVHVVMRGPHGGSVRILRSLGGRVDAELVEKAARLADTTLEGFWAGPPGPADEQERQATPQRRGKTHDSIVSVVLSAHAKARRPLGFEEVVDLCGGRVTRDQVRTASAALCRDGDLDRVRAGVYQLGRAHRSQSPAAVDAQVPPQLVIHHSATASTTEREPSQTMPTEAVELFRRLFPQGVTMTAEDFADFQRWAELTQRLSDQSRAS